MPFDTSTTLLPTDPDPYGLNGVPSRPAPSLKATVGAAWRQDNLIGSLLNSPRMAVDDFYGVNPAYNPFDDLKGYEEYASRFEEVYNERAAFAVKQGIDQEKRDRETLAASGWVGVGASVGATLIDPTFLIPGGALVKAGRLGARALRSGVAVGAMAGVATAVQEAGLQATQEIRPLEESALNIGGSILLGGFLGAGVSAVYTRAEWKAASEAMKAAHAPEFDAATDVLHEELAGIAASREAMSGGAAAAPRQQLDDFEIAGRGASAVAKATAPLNPLLRTLTSPSLAVRSIASQVMETPVYLKRNLAGEGNIAAETAVHEYARGGVVQALDVQRKAFADARKQGLTMTEREFREAVGIAMRRGDKSDVPGVEQAARAWRQYVVEPLKERAISTGLLPKDVQVSTAESYFSRVYNRPMIEGNEAEFKGIVRDWLSGALDQEIKAATARADKALLGLNAQKNEIETGILRRQSAYAERLAGAEADADVIPEEDIIAFVRRFQSGERAVYPERLSDWVRRQRGGIYDPNGELAAVYPELRKIPGLLRKSRKGTFNAKGGEGLDDVVLRAWEEGFLNDAGATRLSSGADRSAERPGIREFLDALDNDLRGDMVVRVGDIEAARVADDFERTLDALSRAGVDLDNPRLATSDAMRGLTERVNRVLDDLDRQRIADLNAKMQDTGRRGATDFLNDLDREDYLSELVDEIYDKVTGRGFDGSLPTDFKIAARGPLRERTFNIPDKLIEKFLDSDVEFVGRRYARLMASDIELTERFGSPDMEGAFIQVRDDYKKLRAAAGTDQKQLDNLTKREKADLRDLQGVRDLLRGHYRPEVQHTTWARIGRAANTFNYMRALGGVTLASLTDAVRPAMVHGLSAYTKDAIRPLLTNLPAFKLSVAEAKKAGAIAERALASRLATLAEITDPYAVSSPFERFLDNAATGFSKLTGLQHWTDFQKSISAVLTQDRILKNATVAAEKGFDALPKKEQAYMAFLGLGRGKAEDVGKLFAAHGETIDGVRVANTDGWGSDPIAAAARRAYRAAVNKDVDSIIVTMGIGDAPLLANTPLGRSLLQFKTFALATNQRVLIRGLQEDKARFVGGLAGMVAVGMFIYWLKQIEAGRDVSNNPGTWVAEGLDRSGIFAVAFEINNALEKANAPGIYTAASAMGQAISPNADARQPASRFAVRSTTGALLGPTFGGVSDTVGLMSLGFENAYRAARGEDLVMSPSDVSAIRRLTPYASLPYWRWFIDGMVVPQVKEGLR